MPTTPPSGDDPTTPNPPALSSAELLPVVYQELRRLAQERMASERGGHTLGATALVHEAWLRLAGTIEQPWQSRAQYFAAAAEAMRRILIDHARNRGRLKKGGGKRPLTLTGLDLANDEDLDQVLEVDEAFERLQQASPRTADVVRLRFYAGLSEAETAATLGVSERSVRRDWSYARAWLFAALRDRAE
ncbi:MAG TPA: ECF-type sigma factor [Planctomycetota bacterium]|nr:ECF-type sigma factor [Planctomycetota bacterium]